MYNHSMILVKDLVEEPLRKTYINEGIQLEPKFGVILS